MNKDIKFSMVVPVYNVEKYLSACLESLVCQTYKNFEIILVDDGSKDNSGKICDCFSIKDSRIKVIHKKNEGVSIARKVGVEEATGEYILCVDADDWIDSDTLGVVYNTLIENEYPDVVQYGFCRVFPDDTVMINDNKMEAGYYNRNRLEKEIFPILIQDKRAHYISPAVWGKCFKRSLFLANMLADKDAVIGEDMACTTSTIFNANSFYILNDSLYFYRMNENSVTQKKRIYPWKCPKILADHLCEKVDMDYLDLRLQMYRYVVHMLYIIACSQFNDAAQYKEIKKNIDSNLKEEFYEETLKKCKFNLLTKGWIAQFILKRRLYGVMYIFNLIK